MMLQGQTGSGGYQASFKPMLSALLFISLLLLSGNCLAIDSYRYLHVTIETPWLIFLFLLPAVLAPLILMAVLYWRFAGRKNGKTKEDQEHDD